MKPLLLGALHGERGIDPQIRLLNSVCKSTFERCIAPELSPDSLLVIEGRWTKVFTPNSWKYQESHESAVRNLGTFARGPALVWRDPRTKFFSFDFMLEHYLYLHSKIYPDICCDGREIGNISSLTEVCERAISMTLPIRLSRLLTKEEIVHLRAVSRSMKRFDEAMSSAALSWNGGGRSYVVSGVAHTMTMHLRTGFPMLYLDDLRIDMVSLLICAFCCISLPIQHNLW